MKFRFWPLCSQLNLLHLVQLFLAGHRHVSCGDTGLIAGHEVFEFIDFLLLTTVGRLKLRFFNRVHFLKVTIVSHIPVQFLIFHMVDDVDNIV